MTDEGIGEFQIRNAIEVSMQSADQSDDPVEIEFSWEIVSFTQYEAEIQLNFSFPESVSSANSDDDNVIITFWAGDLFEAENGKSVRPGLTISAPVTRQISVDDADFYRNIGRYAGFGILGFILLGLALANTLNADTLPIWACYDCLVLITHLPLVNIQVPGKATVVFKEIAQILRLHFEPVQDWYKNVDVGDAARPLTNVLMHNGYDSTSIIINLFPILCIFGLLLVAMVFAKCIDCSYVSSLAQPNPNGRTHVRVLTATQKVVNVMFRMLKVFFLELFICILINMEAKTSGNNDFEAISKIIAIFMLTILTLLVLLFFFITAIESDVERDLSQPPVASLDYVYLGMSNSRRTAANIYLVAYMLRRAVFAVVVILMTDQPALQLLILFMVSGIVAALILRGRPFLTNGIKWSMTIFEFLFAWTCILFMVFSPQYMHQIYTIATDLANAVCIMAGCASFFGLVWLMHSLCWQI